MRREISFEREWAVVFILWVKFACSSCVACFLQNTCMLGVRTALALPLTKAVAGRCAVTDLCSEIVERGHLQRTVFPTGIIKVWLNLKSYLPWTQDDFAALFVSWAASCEKVSVFILQMEHETENIVFSYLFESSEWCLQVSSSTVAKQMGFCLENVAHNLLPS